MIHDLDLPMQHQFAPPNYVSNCADVHKLAIYMMLKGGGGGAENQEKSREARVSDLVSPGHPISGTAVRAH